MDKIIVFILLLFALPVFATQNEDESSKEQFMQSLSLDEIQKSDIEKVKKEIKEKNIKLKEELYNIKDEYKNCTFDCEDLILKAQELNSKIEQNLKSQEERILDLLHFWQKKIYIEHNSRNY